MLTYELLAELDKTVTPAEAGVQKSLKNLVPGLRRDDEKGLLQEALFRSSIILGDRVQVEKDARSTRNSLTHQTHLGYISR
jgi:hypothetical protein